jgi:hypothetical protein
VLDGFLTPVRAGGAAQPKPELVGITTLVVASALQLGFVGGCRWSCCGERL